MHMSLKFFKIRHGLGTSFVGIEQGGLANLIDGENPALAAAGAQQPKEGHLRAARHGSEGRLHADTRCW